VQQSDGAKKADWLVVGSATVDCIVQDNAAVYKSGGVVVYGGLALARQGESVAVCCNLSACDSDVVNPLEREGVMLHCGDSLATTSFVNYVDGDARRQQMTAAAVPIQLSALSELFGHVKYVVLGPLHPLDISEQVMSFCSNGINAVVCVDVQGFARRVVDGWVEPDIAPQVRSVLAAAQIVKMAREELELLLAWGQCNLVELMRMYSLDEVVVTCGSRGGYICTAAGEETHFSAVNVPQVVDPTGAGDVFFAVYLVERLQRVSTVEWAAERAAEHAAAQVAGRFIRAGELGLKRSH